MSSEYISYFDSVGKRLESDGFKVENKVAIGNMVVDLIGRKDVLYPTSRTLVASLTFLEKGDLNTMTPHMSAVTEQAKKYQHSDVETRLGKSHRRVFLSVFPAVASPIFDEEAKERIQSTTGVEIAYRKATMQHPVLAELQTHQIFHYTNREFVWYNELRMARNFANKHFKFE